MKKEIYAPGECKTIQSAKYIIYPAYKKIVKIMENRHHCRYIITRNIQKKQNHCEASERPVLVIIPAARPLELSSHRDYSTSVAEALIPIFHIPLAHTHSQAESVKQKFKFGSSLWEKMESFGKGRKR